MSMLLAPVVDVLASTVLPFVFALALVWATIRLVRVPAGRGRLMLLLLPFAKLVWDVARGIPATSFLWAHAGGVVRESGTFIIGLGASPPCGIKFLFVFGALARGERYGLSSGDLLVLGCDRLGAWCVPVLGCGLLAVSCGLVLRRVLGARRFAAERLRGRRAATTRFLHRLGRRIVDVYVTRAPTPLGAVPLAGGLLRPYVCFPEATFQALSPLERYAVLEHELAHVREGHLAVITAAHVLSDLFWFVPGCRWLAREVASECELIADDRAVAAGAPELELASAIVRTAELMRARQAPPRSLAQAHALVPCAFASRLACRIERLAAGAPVAPPRLWRSWWLRLVWLAVAAQTVLGATVFGNL